MNMVSPSFPKNLIPAKWTPGVVAEWIREAIDTASLLPPHRPAGHRIYWPDVARDRRFDYGDPDKHDVDLETTCSASREAVTRHDEVQRWLGFLGDTDRQIVKHWAKGKPDRWIGRKLTPIVDHRKVKRLRYHALRLIALRLTLEGNAG